MCLGIPGEIVARARRRGLRVGKVRFAGITREVCLDYVPQATAGDYVLVHVGFAIAMIDARGGGALLSHPRGARPDRRADGRPCRRTTRR